MSKLGLVLLFTICIHIIERSYALTIPLLGGIERSSQYAINDLSMAYHLVDPSVEVKTSIMSQEDTLKQIMLNKLDFGITLSSLPDDVRQSHPTISLLPLLVTGLCPIYNLNTIGPNSAPLLITREDLALIYRGTITNWQGLAHSNPLLSLPDRNITLVFEQGSNPLYQVMKKAFNKFLDVWIAPSSSDDDDWPYAKYADYIRVPSGSTTLVSTVIAQDGTLAVTPASIAMLLGVRIAKMTNKAGLEVAVTHDSLELAAIELGTSALSLSTQVTDLLDASNPGAFPLALFAYLIIDTTRSRATCRARQSAVSYFLHLYQSPVVAAMLEDRGAYTAVPSVVMDRLKIKKFLTEEVRCRGQPALPTVATNERFLGTSSQGLMRARLMSTVYLNVNSSFKFTPQVADDELTLTQMMTSELDVGLINPAYIEPAMWQEFVDSDEFLVLPLYAQAVTYFANPLLRIDPYLSLSSSSTEALTPSPFVLTMDLAVNLALSCVRTWDNERLVALNPWLEPILDKQTFRFNYISACAGDMLAKSMVTFVANRAIRDAYLDPVQRDLVQQCRDPAINPYYSALQRSFQKCEPEAGINIQFVKDESSGPPIALGTQAGLAATLYDGDKAKLFPVMQMKGADGKTRLVNSNLTTIMNCAYGSYNSASMWFDLDSSANPNCWPFTQMIVLTVRKRYFSDPLVTNASSCQRGIDALRFARWIATTSDLDAVAASEQSVRLMDADPRVGRDYLAALEAALCDDETLLVTQPIIWDLSPGFAGVGLAAAAIGIGWTAFGMGFIAYYHKQPAVRAASPWFVEISLLGVMMMFASVIALLQPASQRTCSALAWLFDLGLVICFAPLFAKAWRLNKIFGGRKLQVVRISNTKLMMIVTSMIAAELAIMGAWEAVSPLQPLTKTIMTGDREHTYTQCSTTGDGDSFFIAVAIIKGALLIVGAFLSFATRSVTAQFSESAQIATTIYNFVFSIAIIGGVFGFIAPQGDIAIALLFLVAIWVSTVSSLMLVVPKMLIIWGNGNEKNLANGSTTNGDGESAFSFMSLDVFSSLAAIGGYIAALRRHLEAVESRHQMMRKGTPGAGIAQLASPTSTFQRTTRQVEVKPNLHSRITNPTPGAAQESERKSP